jgi:hypothetical protein
MFRAELVKMSAAADHRVDAFVEPSIRVMTVSETLVRSGAVGTKQYAVTANRRDHINWEKTDI